MNRSNHRLSVGQLRRHVRLGSEAFYRVCGFDGQLVEVEVVSAPGLEPGRRLQFMRGAVQRMELVDDSDAGASG